jgi:decaprenyl-phosphate phosphoribosyltransferase
MRAYLKLIRPEQYVKNFFIIAPLFFGGAFLNTALLLQVVLAIVAFSLAASSIYIINDFFDINEDRSHPVKSKRPLASGKIKVRNAFFLQAILMLFALILAFFLSTELFGVICLYIVMNILYSKWLKHVAILDINIIAIGFVLRLLAGAAVSGIQPSIWILLITYLLALFLGIAKRRTDVILAQNGKEVRKNIEGYNLVFIDTVLGVLASIVIVSYIFYCIAPENQKHYHSDLLYVSIIFVVNGIFRYLKLALVDQSTYSPTLIVLKDRFIQITIACWILLMSYLLYCNR